MPEEIRDFNQYRTHEWFESLEWQRPWIEKMAGWWVGEFGRPEKVVDFGAGDGWWCKSLHDMGATAYAVELDAIAMEHMPDSIYSVIHDLRLPIDAGGKFDLVICLEVIEHLPKHDVEDVLINTLTFHTKDLLLISAAVPGQEGTGHINLQPKSHWIKKIEARGTVLFSPARTLRAQKAFKNITNEQFHFLADNLMVFAKI